MYWLNNSLGRNLYEWKASESTSWALSRARINPTSSGFFGFINFIISTEDSNRAANPTSASMHLPGKGAEKEGVGVL